MRDADCVAFLQWALPRLRMRWPGFRKVRRQVCRRVARRLADLGIPDLCSYQSYLEPHHEEWLHLDGLCRISISRFCRDRVVFEHLEQQVLPRLATLATSRGEAEVRAWSCGCAAGEEAYTLTVLWQLLLQPRFPELGFRVLGTDADRHQLDRAQRALYPAGSLKEMPLAWRHAAFEEREGQYSLRQEFQAGARFRRQDIRREIPRETFHLVLCRNLAFTYFDEDLQREIALALYGCLVPGGVLVLGKHERLPRAALGFRELAGSQRMYSRMPVPASDLGREGP